ncbi:rieske (2Fe-2S) subunit of the bc1complex [Candidatus Scalindua japonica]|uniref:Rieske (2Fe-2S) subunit of the bc1complex n=1 Tax=Candidatus Scalindua japonica TaxID=1284222 RepID=A0A286U437_9BACT|nr:ubiquinol-cytochrome c reductase iron-sulfur subunit [Candidatus Scalindua japonica]GAX62886.1 rieske (2Fe-2S) subunit of the bc1complex [Candidatus Scalindua japonica]
MNNQVCKEETVLHTNQGRRNFLKICSVVLSSLIGIAYAVPLIRAFISPALQETVSGSTGLIEVGSVGDCVVNVPRKVKIVDTKVDAWTKFPPTEIGAVWVILGKDKKFTVFTSICPHLGCGVDWDNNSGKFICPCHDSYFDIEGRVLSGPSPRGMDTLEAEIKDGKIFVEYRKMKLGVSEKMPA